MTPSVEVILSPSLLPYHVTQPPFAAVAVDVLRATTSICAAMHAGASIIVPVEHLDDLPSYREQGYSLAVERDGKKLMGADCGNSPTEYMQMDLTGQRLAYCTTNGTRCILNASACAERTFIGCFANLSALASKLIQEAPHVVILCSGWRQNPSIEDTLMAGVLVQLLSQQGYSILDDSAHMALQLFLHAQPDIYGFCLQHASHVSRLQRLGYDADIQFALKADSCTLVPEYIHPKGIVAWHA
ncbi:MAG: 2-phosphosulfolactate phosphatase [Bacteroidales bacterium]|nr:2-phosphosulfolactate phosphatase [Candidatus Colimorpha onthohippi]